ncbi:hypothetical protein THOE12_20836 [Vibrio rotiferianus]|nr:hypothetical protein THOE12_20836 [Vibrio rotiferianus]
MLAILMWELKKKKYRLVELNELILLQKKTGLVPVLFHS